MSLCTDRLDQALSPTYVTEPISIICGDKPLAQTVEEALNNWAGVPSEALLEFPEGSPTYTPPGGVEPARWRLPAGCRPVGCGCPRVCPC